MVHEPAAAKRLPPAGDPQAVQHRPPAAASPARGLPLPPRQGDHDEEKGASAEGGAGHPNG